jgi:hypothetical protein
MFVCGTWNCFIGVEGRQTKIGPSILEKAERDKESEQTSQGS